MLPSGSTNRITRTISGSRKPTPPFRADAHRPLLTRSPARSGVSAPRLIVRPGSRISPQSHATAASRDPKQRIESFARLTCCRYALLGQFVYQNVILDRAPTSTKSRKTMAHQDGPGERSAIPQRMSRVLHCAAVIRTRPQTVRSRHSLGRLSDKATCKGWLRPS